MYNKEAMTKEAILDMFARDKMIDWDLQKFKRSHPSLFAVIIESMEQYANKESNCFIDNMKTIQAACDGKDLVWVIAEKMIQECKTYNQ